MKKGETKPGFTMIEAALVIAIAGLIFLMIFIAVPWLRATQRDAERREDLIYFIEEVKNFQRKNRGTLPGVGQVDTTISWSDTTNPDTVTPTSWAGFYRDYLKEDFTDPDGENYKLEIKNCSKVNVVGKVCNEETLDDLSFPNDYKIIVTTSAICTNDRPVQAGDIRRLAATYIMQNGGIACVSSR